MAHLVGPRSKDLFVRVKKSKKKVKKRVKYPVFGPFFLRSPVAQGRGDVTPKQKARVRTSGEHFFFSFFFATYFSRFAARWPTLAGLVQICSGSTLAHLGSKYPTLATSTPGWHLSVEGDRRASSRRHPPSCATRQPAWGKANESRIGDPAKGRRVEN